MSNKIIHKLVILSCLWSYTLFPFAQAVAQETCSELLQQAEQNYYEGNFDVSIALVRDCLKGGNHTPEELIWAYKILAQTYLAKNNPDAANQIVGKILELNPDYAPTIAEDPPQYVELVNNLKKQQSAQTSDPQSSDTKWLWIGAGSVAVIGIITIIALSGDDEVKDPPKPLSTPPSFPAIDE
jgi:hypothetical protein